MSEISSHYNMAQWAAAMERLEEGPVTRALIASCQETKFDTTKEFEELCLPTFSQYTMSLDDFFVLDNVRTDSMKSERLWFQIAHKDGTSKVTRLDVEDYAIPEMAYKILAGNEPQDYNILVSEYLENKYGGHIVIDGESQIYIEFGEGPEYQYSDSRIPQFKVQSDQYTGVMNYSFEDVFLREKIYSALTAIPHIYNESFRPLYHPGYYEFVLCSDNLRPVFLDYRSSSLYSL